MATATKPSKTFSGLRCPHCGGGADDGGLAVKVEDLTLECLSCSEEVTASEIKEMIATWKRLLLWVEIARNTPDQLG